MLVSSSFSSTTFFTPVSEIGVREVVLLDLFPGRLSWLPDGTCLVRLGITFDLDGLDISLVVFRLIVEVAEQLSHVVLIFWTFLLSENVTAVPRTILRTITQLQRLFTLRSYRIQGRYRPGPLKGASGGFPDVVAILIPVGVGGGAMSMSSTYTPSRSRSHSRSPVALDSMYE